MSQLCLNVYKRHHADKENRECTRCGKVLYELESGGRLWVAPEDAHLGAVESA